MKNHARILGIGILFLLLWAAQSKLNLNLPDNLKRQDERTIETIPISADDGFEDNDIIGGARNMSTGTYSDLVAEDDDWYYASVEVGQHVEVMIEFNHSHSNLQLQLLTQDSEVRNSSDHSTVSIGVESCTYTPIEGVDPFVNEHNNFFKIYIFINTTDTWGANYNLTVLVDDAFEPNNDLNTAYPIDSVLNKDNCVANDDDFYKITVPIGCRLVARLQYSFYPTSGGNLTFHLRDAAGAILKTASKIPLGATGSVMILYINEPPVNRTYYVQVDTAYGTCDRYNIEIYYEQPEDDDSDRYSGGNDSMENATSIWEESTNLVQFDDDWYYTGNSVEEGRMHHYNFVFTLDELAPTEFLKVEIFYSNKTLLATHISNSALTFNMTADIIGPYNESIYLKVSGSNWGVKYNITYTRQDIKLEENDDGDGFSLPGYSMMPFGLLTLLAAVKILLQRKKQAI